MKKTIILFILCISIMAVACSGSGEDPQTVVKNAIECLEKKQYEKAEKYFLFPDGMNETARIAMLVAGIPQGFSLKVLDSEINGKVATVNVEFDMTGFKQKGSFTLIDKGGWKIILKP